MGKLCSSNRVEVEAIFSGKGKAHKHKQVFSGDCPGGGGSPDRVARGQSFMCCLRNPRSIKTFLSGYPQEDR